MQLCDQLAWNLKSMNPTLCYKNGYRSRKKKNMVNSTSQNHCNSWKTREKYHLHLPELMRCWVHAAHGLANGSANVWTDSWCDHCKKLDELDIFCWNVGCLEVLSVTTPIFVWGFLFNNTGIKPTRPRFCTSVLDDPKNQRVGGHLKHTTVDF